MEHRRKKSGELIGKGLKKANHSKGWGAKPLAYVL
jgi:hypothetical protein